jgi:hypothetical protein
MTARPISAHQPVLDPLREELLGGVVRLAGPGLVAARPRGACLVGYGPGALAASGGTACRRGTGRPVT